MEKCLKWKNRGNVEALRGRAERANELPSYSPDWQRGSLCACGARPNSFHTAETPEHSHIKPEYVRITHELM